jgi:single-stranded-DNA-specific exonuclease
MQLSILGQRWVMPSPQSASARLGAALAQATGLPPVVAAILANRGYADAATATAFLNPRLDVLPDPATLKDMDKAVARLATAIRAREKIAIFGDYDVDGTCATALVSRYLQKLGITPTLYIPHRLTEGYGPTPEAMKTLAAQGTQLLITVDTGTTAHAALAEAQRLGMDVIVTDHHQPEGSLPPAAAILNPHRVDDTSALQGLCGSGVAFYLLLALNRHLRESGFFNAEIPEPNLNHSLDLVALATVADVMPLTGINRVLVAKGMQQLATWRHRGLAALAGVAGVKDDISATSIGFSLAPRLNAAGRVESAQAALGLLMSDDDAAALPLAETLNQLNQQRQGLEKAILAEARRQAEEQFTADTLALVLHAQGWHPGVVGIVASRIKEAFNRPTFILGGDGSGLLKGSGRSIGGFNLGAAVHAGKAHLVSGGGHAMAAGVSLNADNLDAFKASLHAALSSQLEQRGDDATQRLSHRLAPTLTLEAATTPVGLTAELAQSLQQLAPFGSANPEPVLALSNVKITYARPVGATQEHLKLRLSDVAGTVTLDAVCFGAMNSALGPALTNSGGRALTLAVTAKPRTFNGKTLMDIHVKDAHTSPTTSHQ